MYSPTLQNLINHFSKFPTVGPRTAARFVFYLINSPVGEVKELVEAIAEIKNKIKICSFCGKSFEGFNRSQSPTLPQSSPSLREGEEQGGGGLCSICLNPSRDKSILCLVEKEMDLEAIEKTSQYKGLYFILTSAFPNFDFVKKDNKSCRSAGFVAKEKMEKRVGQLVERIKKDGVKEIILALNPTPEGQRTALLIKRRLEPLKIKTTQLARGLPMGGELEYADEETLTSAFANRK